jgi:hypothetical protein
MEKPSVSIEATSHGLRWKVVQDGETVGSGPAQSMEDAQAAADALVSRITTKPGQGPERLQPGGGDE